jgi:hypothetical protein
MKENELTCEYAYWGGGIVKCDKPAVYTFRAGGRVYHYCKEHYQEVKEDFEDE